MPLPMRLLLVLIHLRTNLTTRGLAAPFATSQSTLDPTSITSCRCWATHCARTPAPALGHGSSTPP
ncbi:hypothetical protein [Mycobacterium sp.]|uniref:hypothetical protein n=1 Tax=Mycobacterium sp. TaxID=1785 RepID=UPI00333ECE92